MPLVGWYRKCLDEALVSGAGSMMLRPNPVSDGADGQVEAVEINQFEGDQAQQSIDGQRPRTPGRFWIRECSGGKDGRYRRAVGTHAVQPDQGAGVRPRGGPCARTRSRAQAG